MKIKFISIFILLFLGLSSLVACSSKPSTSSMAHTWHLLNTKATMTFYQDGTTRNVWADRGTADVLEYKVQEDGTLVFKMEWGSDLYLDKTDSALRAMDDNETYYLQDEVLIYYKEIYYIEDNETSKKRAEELYDTTMEELNKKKEAQALEDNFNPSIYRNPSTFMSYFSKSYKVIEEEVNERKWDANDHMLLLWEAFEEFQENAPDETTYFKDKTFEPITLTDAIATRCYVWIPKYREVAVGEVQTNGEIGGKDGAVFDYIVNKNKDYFSVHLNYGSFEDGMLNGEGTSFRCNFEDGDLQSNRLMIGNFIKNRLDGEIKVTVNMAATNEQNTQIQVANGKAKTFGLNEKGRAILGYFEEDGEEFTWPADDAEDVYSTFYDRLTNNTY